MANKFWEWLASIQPHAKTLQQFQTINAELDRYLIDLARLEFNLDADDLALFNQSLENCSDEMERNLTLKKEVVKRGIDLPYEMGNSDSTRKWLISLSK